MFLTQIRNEHHKRHLNRNQNIHFQTSNMHDSFLDKLRNRLYDQPTVHNGSTYGNKNISDSTLVKRCFHTDVLQPRQRQHLQTSSARQDFFTNKTIQHLQTSILQTLLRTVIHAPSSSSKLRLLVISRLRPRQHIPTDHGINTKVPSLVNIRIPLNQRGTFHRRKHSD